MRIGIPKEIKSDEYRVAMMPVGVAQLVKKTVMAAAPIASHHDFAWERFVFFIMVCF